MLRIITARTDKGRAFAREYTCDLCGEKIAVTEGAAVYDDRRPAKSRPRPVTYLHRGRCLDGLYRDGDNLAWEMLDFYDSELFGNEPDADPEPPDEPRRTPDVWGSPN